MVKAQGAFSFLEPELMELTEELFERFLEENEKLRLYKRYMEEITTGNNVDYIRELQQRMH